MSRLGLCNFNKIKKEADMMNNTVIIDTSILQHYIQILQKRKKDDIIKIAGEEAIKEIKTNSALSKQDAESAEDLVRRLFNFNG